MMHLFIGLLLYGQISAKGGSISDHAFYLGVVQINHEAVNTDVKIRIKVFKDDLRDALRNAFSQITSLKEETLCDYPESLANYIEQHTECLINDKVLDWEMESCELEGNVCLLTFTADCPSTWKSLELKGDFLMELFPSQVNVVSVFDGEEKRFFRLTGKNPQQKVVF